nr:GAF domain-containing SpoIIE family protein phosphatase [Cellulomonas taurus]
MHEATPDRDRLLATVMTELTRTLDAEVAVGRLARLLCPTLADWCVISLVDDDESRMRHRRLRDIGWWHTDPDHAALVQEYAATRIGALRSSSMLMDAMDSGQVVHVPSDALTALHRVLEPGRARELADLLAPESLTVMPLQSRGRTLGAVSLFNGPQRPALSDAQRATLTEVASAAAVVLDNARLYRRQRDVALTFQRSLLTAPVEPDHVEVAVRYQPAAEGAQVGGDWYDAFLQPDGSTMLVIGDVVGHDIEAAAVMAQLRSMLRGIAVVTQDSPAEVLAHLDAAARTLRITTMASALVARLEQTDRERELGVTRVRWAAAGHPPPMVVTEHGEVTALVAQAPGLLLGIDPQRPRVDSEVVLERGTTLLMYTDGLIERRTRSIRDGMAALQDALSRHARRDLDSLCDRLLAELPAGPGDDDVALIAARLHPQDRPRPPEAGPNVVPPDVPDDEADISA